VRYTGDVIAMKDPAIRLFAERLRERLGDNLQQLILFGSRARGDSWEGSDYDFVVLVVRKDQAALDAVAETRYDLLNLVDLPASSMVYTPDEWRLRQDSPFGMNVLREGLSVL